MAIDIQVNQVTPPITYKTEVKFAVLALNAARKPSIKKTVDANVDPANDTKRITTARVALVFLSIANQLASKSILSSWSCDTLTPP